MKRLVPIWKKFYSHLTRYSRFYVIAFLVLAIVLAILLPLTYSWNRLEQYALSQLVCSILTLLVILYALVPALKQLRIAEAKPRLSLAFDESGSTETTLEVIKGQDKRHPLRLWMSNCGDAVAKEFQVELSMSEVLVPHFMPLFPDEVKLYRDRRSGDKAMVTIGFFDLVTPCFVNRPINVMTLSLLSEADSYDLCPREYRIGYRIYGTWGREQGGELRVRLKKTGGTLQQPAEPQPTSS